MQAARDDDVARADTAFSENIKHVYEEFYVSTCYDKNVKSLKKIKREAGNTRATALQNNDHASLAVISTEEETLTKAIKMEEENAKDSAGCAIYAASRAMGLTSVPARDAKASKAAIERIVALDLGRPTAAVNPLAATEIKEAIKQYVLADIANRWALVPHVKRLHDTGTEGWETAKQEDLMGWKSNEMNKGSKEEKMAAFVTYCTEKLHFTKHDSPKFMVDSNSEEENDFRMASFQVKCFAEQNAALYAVLREAQNTLVEGLINGRRRFVGDRSGDRQNCCQVDDGLSICETLLLQTETYGAFAKDDARDAMMHSVGHLVSQDWRRGVRLMMAKLKLASDLGCDITYHQSIFKYMQRLRHHRSAIAMQLESNWGNIRNIQGVTHTSNVMI